MLVQIYDYRLYYNDLKIEISNEPPESFITLLVQTLIQAAILKRDIDEHECTAECAISSFVMLGYPYNINLEQAVPR